MTIQLTAEQRTWLEAAVAAGRFASVQAAIDAAVLGLMTDLDFDTPEDVTRTASLLDAARASDARGESVSLEDFRSRGRRQRGA